MRVIIYFNSQYPFGSAATNRVHQICRGLHLNGVDVNLVITNATEKNRDTLNLHTEGVFEGIEYKYLSKRTIRTRCLVLRKINDLTCYLRTYRHLLCNTNQNDSIIVIGGATLDFRVMIPFLAKWTGREAYLEINEYPFVTKSDGIWKTLRQQFFFKLVVPLYKGFIVISGLLAQKIEAYRSKKARVILIPILSEAQDYKEINNSSPCPFPYIIHAGSLFEEKDGILGSLKAFKKARKEKRANILYVIAGDLKSSPDANEIIKYVKEEGLEESVIFTGYLVDP